LCSKIVPGGLRRGKLSVGGKRKRILDKKNKMRLTASPQCCRARGKVVWSKRVGCKSMGGTKTKGALECFIKKNCQAHKKNQGQKTQWGGGNKRRADISVKRETQTVRRFKGIKKKKGLIKEKRGEDWTAGRWYVRKNVRTHPCNAPNEYIKEVNRRQPNITKVDKNNSTEKKGGAPKRSMNYIRNLDKKKIKKERFSAKGNRCNNQRRENASSKKETRGSQEKKTARKTNQTG